MTTSKATQLTITIPDGATPGAILSIPIKSGSETVKARVPEGLGPGGTLVLVKPEGSDQWVEELPEGPANAPLEETTQLVSPSPSSPVKNLVAYTVRLDTTVGVIDIIVRPDWAPHGARRFLELAAVGDLDDLAFYRAVKGCLAQFGLPARRQWQPLPDDPPTGVPFLLGAVCFAAVQQDSRKSTLFICIGDMSHCFGQNAWETPIGAVAESSLDVLERIETIYGDIKELNGAGPDAGRLRAEGNSYLRSDFPLLTYIRSAWPLDWQLSMEEQPTQPLADASQADGPSAREGLAAASNGAPQASRFAMVSQFEGQYCLQATDQSQCLSGSYAFNPKSGELIDRGTGEVVGVFSCDPISHEPLPVRGITAEATMKLPCIRIEDSEVMAEIQKACNAGAVFVLPSQLNGAEYPSHNTVVGSLDSYKYDNTGGPRGQLAVHPAPGQFVLDNAASERRPNGINAVSETVQRAREAGFNFQLLNGYLSVPPMKDAEEMKKSIHVIRQHLHGLRLLVMQNVPACGLTPDKRALSRTNHKVSLVYASAVPVQAYINAGANADQEAFQMQVAEAVLVAQYYGSLKLAAQKRLGATTTIFLMPLGGGVFNNPWESIAAAMSRAVEMLSDEERACLDIRALTWSGNPAESSTLARLLLLHGKLKVMNGGGDIVGSWRGAGLNSTAGLSMMPPAVQPNTAAPPSMLPRGKTEMHVESRVEATVTSSEPAELAEATRTANAVRQAAVAAQAALLARTAEAVEAARTGGTGPQVQSVHLRSQASAGPHQLMAPPGSAPVQSSDTAPAYPAEQQLMQQLPQHQAPQKLQQQLWQQQQLLLQQLHQLQLLQQDQNQQPPQAVPPPLPTRGVADQAQLRRDPAGVLQDWRAEYFRQQQEVPVEALGVGVPVETVSNFPVGVPVEIMPHRPGQYPPYATNAEGLRAQSPSNMLHRLYSNDVPPRSLSPMPQHPGSLETAMRMRSSPSPTQTTVSTTHYGEPTVRTTNVHHYPPAALGMFAPRHLDQPPPSPMPTATQPHSPMPSLMGLTGALLDGRPPMDGYQSPAAPPPWAMGIGGPLPGYGDPGRGPLYGGQDLMSKYGEPAPSPYPSGLMQVPPQMGPATSYQPPPLQSQMGMDLGGAPPLGSGGMAGGQGSTGALGMLSWSPLQPPQLIPPMLNSPMMPGLGGPPMGPLSQPPEQQMGMASPPAPFPWPMQY